MQLFVLIFDYLRLPFTALFAFLLFQEVTDFWIWIGGLIIFYQVRMLLTERERQARKQVLL